MSSAYSITFVMFLLVATSLAYLIPDRDGPVAAPVDADVDEADERLATDDEMVAIRAEFDRMLVAKGMVTNGQIELIRHGTKSRAVVTGMLTTGHACEVFARSNST